jgi:hypothetical protein
MNGAARDRRSVRHDQPIGSDGHELEASFNVVSLVIRPPSKHQLAHPVQCNALDPVAKLGKKKCETNIPSQ